MRNFRKLLVLLLLVVALPLRGYAALAVDLCAGHNGGAAGAHAGHHDPSSDHEHEAPDGPSATSSSCSHCASCSVGASVAPEAKQISLPVAGSDRIPFFDQHKSGYVPDHPERPPLVS